jgi:hypothetical protein
MQSTVSNIVGATRRSKRGLLIVLGAIQVAAGATVAVAPHLATILGPRPFAITMAVCGIGSAVLAFVKAEVATGGSDE